MTTAQIFFSFVAAALVFAGGVRLIRGGFEQIIPAAALGQSGVFIWMLVRGENPVEVAFRWIFFLALCGFFYWLHKGKLQFPQPGDNESDPPLGKHSSVVEVLRRAVRIKWPVTQNCGAIIRFAWLLAYDFWAKIRSYWALLRFSWAVARNLWSEVARDWAITRNCWERILLTCPKIAVL